MDAAKDWVLNNPASPQIHIIQADQQTQGRGKPGSYWSSPKGNLYVTLILPFHFSVAELSQLSFLMAVALGDILLVLNNSLPLQYKWPNDILLAGKKAGGILLEPFEQTTLIGIGLNINSFPEDLPATCLKDYGLEFSPHELIKCLMPFLTKWLDIWKKESFGVIRSAWLKRAFRLKETISVRILPTPKEGVFQDIDENGNLILIEKNGTNWRLASGDIFVNKELDQ